jgi:hypothetical protein
VKAVGTNSSTPLEAAVGRVVGETLVRQAPGRLSGSDTMTGRACVGRLMHLGGHGSHDSMGKPGWRIQPHRTAAAARIHENVGRRENGEDVVL